MTSSLIKSSSQYDRSWDQPADQKLASPTRNYERQQQFPLSPSASGLGASLVDSFTSKLSTSDHGSNSGPVNWSAFKAKRAGSASAVSQSAAASNQNLPKEPFVPTGPKSAAAGLSVDYIKAATPAEAALAPKSDSTVIEGAAVFPIRSPTAASAAPETGAPIRRNPWATPATASADALGAPPAALRPISVVRGSPVSAAAAAAAGEGGVRAIQTFSCPDCRRNFKRGSLMKHQKVCKKVFSSKRGPFDSAKMRTQDLAKYQDATEEEEAAAEEGDRPRTAMAKKDREEAKEQTSTAPAASSKDWKDKSESLREAMRRAKQQKAQFGTSNKMGIDMRAMMMKPQR